MNLCDSSGHYKSMIIVCNLFEKNLSVILKHKSQGLFSETKLLIIKKGNKKINK